jgi:hypothetical protein
MSATSTTVSTYGSYRSAEDHEGPFNLGKSKREKPPPDIAVYVLAIMALLEEFKTEAAR